MVVAKVCTTEVTGAVVVVLGADGVESVVGIVRVVGVVGIVRGVVGNACVVSGGTSEVKIYN